MLVPTSCSKRWLTVLSNKLEELLRDPHALRILIYLLINGSSLRSRIARALSIDYYALEKKLRYLEEIELIARCTDFSPRPRQLYMFTNKGLELLEQLTRRIASRLFEKRRGSSDTA